MVPYKRGHSRSCVQNKGRLSRCLWPGLAFTVWTLPEQTIHGANLRSPECSFWLRQQTELNSSEWWGTPAFYNNRSALLASVHAARETTVWIFIISCQQMTGRQTLSPLVVWKVALFFSDCPGVTSQCQKGSQCEKHWSRTCLFIWLYVFIYSFEFLALTLSAKYFWRHYLIISILIDFWALASPTLCHVCATAVCVSCVCHYCIPIWNTIKGCGEKWLGLSYANECRDQSLQFAFHPRSHFIWKNIRRKPHIGLHRFTKQFKVLHRLRGRQCYLLITLCHHCITGPVAALAVGKRGPLKEWVRLNDGSQAIVAQRIPSQRFI